MIDRQKTIEIPFSSCRNLTKMDAVPKRNPAVMPSAKEAFLVLLCMQTAFSFFN
jgi:hypothetical protein